MAKELVEIAKVITGFVKGHHDVDKVMTDIGFRRTDQESVIHTVSTGLLLEFPGGNLNLEKNGTWNWSKRI